MLTQPQLIEDIHRAYLEAGADIIETYTFNASRLALAEFGLRGSRRRDQQDGRRARPPCRRRVHAPQSGQAALRRRQHRADQQDALHRARHVDDPGDAIADLRRVGRQLLRAGRRPGRRRRRSARRETGIDTLVLKACLFAIDKYFAEHGVRLPVMVSGTIFDRAAAPCSAQTLEAFYVSVSHFDALSVGFNCGVGVDLMRPAVESLAQISRQADRLLSQRRPARRLRRLRGHRPRRHRRRCSASSPATAGSTSSAAAAAPRPSGSPPSPSAVEGVTPRRVPDLPGWSYFSGNEAARRPARDQLRHGRRADATSPARASSPA